MSDTAQKHSQMNKRVRLDPRVTQLIEQGVANKHRSIFLVVGDKSRELIAPLLQLLARARSEAHGMPSLLWCYKKDLGFTTHRRKRMKELQKKIRIGLIDPKEGDPWELFISSTNIRYCYYAETHKILGNTFGACVLQDFEALTPNTLARTIETVEGGGLVLILLRTLQSLKQLYTLTMDVHARYRTDSHQDVVGRFNERFLLSLSACHAFLALDDTYHVLPLSSKSLKKPLPDTTVSTNDELTKLKDSLSDTKPLIDVLKCCCTLDQSKTLLKLADSISDKTLRATVAITAARGRGKSACMGLALAMAIAFGYGAIFVTSPSPENLRTLFEFLFKGLDALSYEEHTDYEILRSTNPEFKGAVTRLNVFREHRQIVQYIHPKDSHYLAHAELLVIDEAAAIPLPMVRKLLGPYLIFMASTVNGYEGTGRSLSLKLIDQLKTQCSQYTSSGKDSNSLGETHPLSSSRLLHEITLEEPIRYGPGDLVENWLHDLLCLDVNKVPRILSGCPSPSECDLYFVNRDTLFSYHRASEQFLHRLMSLYVSSHYRNTPNDLQLMSDAPAHKVFVLLGPTALDQTSLPEILCVMQVCLEGAISSARIKSGLSRGIKASGDLIPWTVSEQFQDFEFCNLSGARVVRIATHPDYQGMGYGSRALSLLKQYYSGLIPCVGEGGERGIQSVGEIDPDEKETLISEQIKPRQDLPPLLLQLSERRAEKLDYLGVSYGVTESLLKFWKRAGYLPVYLRQTANELTGEHTVVMLQGLSDSTPEWLDAYCTDFARRFIQLLSFRFREFPVTLALNILYRNRKQPETNAVNDTSDVPADPPTSVSLAELHVHLSKYDLKRVHLYARHLVDYHLILDLLPAMTRLYFLERTNFRLSLAQCAILLGVGLQHKSPDDLSKEMEIPTTQLLGLFVRSIRKFSKFFKDLEESAISESLPPESTIDTDLLSVGEERVSLEQELVQAAKEVQVQQAKELKEFLQSDLTQYSVTGAEQDWQMALGSGKKQTMISIPSSAKRRPVDTDQLLKEMSREGSHKKMKKQSRRDK